VSAQFSAIRPAGDLLAACEPVLGPVTLVRDMSWPGNGNQVAEVRDASGRSWVAKIIAEPDGYRAELSAYRNWVPALGAAAPALRAADDSSRLLVVSLLAGRRAEESGAQFDPAVHEQAGRLTRRLHEAEPPVIDDRILAATLHSLERWIKRGRDLLSEDDIAFARDRVAPLAGFGPVPTVPCHMDNHPRNWLVDDEGTVSLIDFGGCERDVWIRDLQRLYFQQWQGRPDLRDAFYAGYGRTPAADDLAMLRCYLAKHALSTVVWAHEHGDQGFEQQGRRILAELRSGASPESAESAG
jgi:Phosphotransferase enzyme family